MQQRNVVIFGETGAGKSSVVNLLAGRDVAKMASTAKGCTFQYNRYPTSICGAHFNIYDTAGLNEGDPQTMNRMEAIRQMYQLLISLKDGVSLLVFCMRAPRIKDSYLKNWQLFHEVICAKKVPIVIVITGLENEDSMDGWWFQNRDRFYAYGMTPMDYACITATKGKVKNGRCAFQEEYSESREKVQRVVTKSALWNPWVVPKIQWLVETSIRCRKVKIVGPEVLDMLKRCTNSKDEAEELARLFDKVKPKELN